MKLISSAIVLLASAIGGSAEFSSIGKVEAPRATIEVTATFIQFERAVVENEPALREEGRLTHRHVLEMWKADKGSLRSAMSVTTLDSVAATATSGREIIYPTEHSAQAFSLLDEEREAFTVTLMVPKSFETRETGNVLMVTPRFDRKANVVTLILSAQIAEFVEWLDLGLSNSTKQPYYSNIPSPVFSTHEVNTQLSIRNGDTTVVGGGLSEDGKWVRYVIVSAQAY